MTDHSTPPNTVVFLGAGASAADGAPVQSTLFRDYFKLKRESLDEQGQKQLWRERHIWDDELGTFFQLFFGIDVDHDDLDQVEFPTFEEVLGILEIAHSQDESFRDFLGRHLIQDGSSQIQHIHDLLVFSIAEILHHKLGYAQSYHEMLVDRLDELEWLRHTTFVSFNYDILIDNALSRRGRLNYGFSFVNERQSTSSTLRLFKPHGSLNWLYCTTCRDVRLTPQEKGVMRIRNNPGATGCDKCNTPRSAIVIPPTFFKVISNLYLRMVWDAAEKVCEHADRVVFCGYSFPDADIHVRYLLKRVERIRESTPEIFVVNHHATKIPNESQEESRRYRRFFVSSGQVHYTDISFDEFANSPRVVEDSGRWL